MRCVAWCPPDVLLGRTRSGAISMRWSAGPFKRRLQRRAAAAMHRVPRMRLEEALRVDVDVEPEGARALGCGGEPFPQIAGEIEAARRFYQQAEAVAAAHDGERGLRRTEHADLVGQRRGRGETARIGLGGKAL